MLPKKLILIMDFPFLNNIALTHWFLWGFFVFLFSRTKLSCISTELEDAITQSKGLLFLKKWALLPLMSERYIFIFQSWIRDCV